MNASSSTTATPCPLPKLLRCFCNCSALTYDEVYTISRMNVAAILSHTQALRLFKSFLGLATHTVRPTVFRHVELAELCARVMRTDTAESDDIDELFEQCPSLDWERRLEDATTDASPAALADYCEELHSWLVRGIEGDPKWSEFQLELRRKLGT